MRESEEALEKILRLKKFVSSLIGHLKCCREPTSCGRGGVLSEKTHVEFLYNIPTKFKYSAIIDQLQEILDEMGKIEQLEINTEAESANIAIGLDTQVTRVSI